MNTTCVCPFGTGLWALGEGLWHGDCQYPSVDRGLEEDWGLVGVPLPLPVDPLSSEMDMELRRQAEALKPKVLLSG